MTLLLANIECAANLDAAAKGELEALLDIHRSVDARNRLLREHYEGDARPAPLGICALPDTVRPEARNTWARKAVTSVSERCVLEGFAFEGDYRDEGLAETVRRNRTVQAFNRATPGMLTDGCMFATVGKSGGLPIVRFHTAQTAAGDWDDAGQCLRGGYVIARTERTPWSPRTPVPTLVNLHLPDRTVAVFRRGPSEWAAESMPHKMGRPMMEAFAYRPTGAKPLGETRISGEVRWLADEANRIMEDMAVAAELFAAPQKFLLGRSEKQFKKMSKNKMPAYMGLMLLATESENGGTPTYGQLPATQPTAYVEILALLAKMYSASTGVPLSSLGIVTDNPASAEAIAAAREDIITAAEDLRESCECSLREVAIMAMAVGGSVRPDELSAEQLTVAASFGDPAKPSTAAQADASVKLAGAVPGFGFTDEFWRMNKFTPQQIDSIKAQIADAEARQTAARLSEIVKVQQGGTDTAATDEG